MWEHIRSWTPRAKKRHRCAWCGTWIEVGEKHRAWCGKMDGDFQQNRMHDECHAAFHRDLDYIDEGFLLYENPKGLTSSEVEEYGHLHISQIKYHAAAGNLEKM